MPVLRPANDGAHVALTKEFSPCHYAPVPVVRFFASLFAATLAATVLSGCPAPSNNAGGAGSTTTTGGGTTAPTGDGIVIAWAEWEPAKQLEVLAKDFTAETKIPFPSFVFRFRLRHFRVRGQAA